MKNHTLILTDGRTAEQCGVEDNTEVAVALRMLAQRVETRVGRRMNHRFIALLRDREAVLVSYTQLWNVLGQETDFFREFCMEAQTNVGFPDSERS
jgi:hypothetical protein